MQGARGLPILWSVRSHANFPCFASGRGLAALRASVGPSARTCRLTSLREPKAAITHAAGSERPSVCPQRLLPRLPTLVTSDPDTAGETEAGWRARTYTPRHPATGPRSECVRPLAPNILPRSQQGLAVPFRFQPVP